MDTQTPQALLREIKTATGWSEPRIAKELEVSQPTVNRLLNGQSECKASTWRALCNLREKVKAKAVNHPPRTRPKVPD